MFLEYSVLESSVLEYSALESRLSYRLNKESLKRKGESYIKIINT